MRRENELIWKTLTEGADEFDGPGMQFDGIDDDITEQIRAKATECAECITKIFALVEDEGQEMLDKQAAEKLEDIIEHASNALRELKLRLD